MNKVIRYEYNVFSEKKNEYIAYRFKAIELAKKWNIRGEKGIRVFKMKYENDELVEETCIYKTF